MDFITPIITIAWKIFKKAWPYILIAILAGIVCLLFASLKKQRSRADRQEQNTQALFRKASEITQRIELTRRESREIPEVDSMIQRAASRVGVSRSMITGVHSLSGISRIDTVYRIDTLIVDGVASRVIRVSDRCLYGTIELSDTLALLRLEQSFDLDLFAYRERPKGWFFKMKWNRNKWPVSVKVVNNCSDSTFWSKNINIDLVK